MDVNFVKAFIEASLETLKVQCSCNFKAGKPHQRTTDEVLAIEIAGIIGLSSKTFSGSIALEFPEKTFLGVMSGMLGETYTEINSDLQDGAAELLNIIFGQAKRKLNAAGYEIEKALPTVVRGKDIQVTHKKDVPSVIAPFNSEIGDFWIEIVMDQ